MTDKQKKDRIKYITLYPVLGEAFRLKELFDDFWDFKDVEEATAFLSYWRDLVNQTSIQPYKKFINTLKSHWSGIINFIKTGITNRILESINTKIQLAKKSKGFQKYQKSYQHDLLHCW